MGTAAPARAGRRESALERLNGFSEHGRRLVDDLMDDARKRHVPRAGEARGTITPYAECLDFER